MTNDCLRSAWRPRCAGRTMIALVLATTLSPRPLVVAYVPNWIDLAAFAETIDYAKVTHLNVAFENPVDDAGNLSFNPADAVLVKKGHAKGVKVLVSIGGGAATDAAFLKRAFALIAPPNRASFVRKLTDYVVAHGFDGLDVDLEGPAINADYGPFVRELATALKRRRKLLTAALSKGYGGDRVPDDVLRAFDFVNVMAYDATGPWAPDRPGQHASFDFAKENVAYWLAHGLPKSKTVLGVPFYGYGFGTDFRSRDWPYREILAAHPDAAKKDEVASTVWYNGATTIRAKAEYVVKEGLAGAMIWSLDSDAPGEGSLLTVLDAALRAKTPLP